MGREVRVMTPLQHQALIGLQYLILFIFIGCMMLYVRIRKDRIELHKEYEEKKADISKPKGHPFIRHYRSKYFMGPYDIPKRKQKYAVKRKSLILILG